MTDNIRGGPAKIRGVMESAKEAQKARDSAEEQSDKQAKSQPSVPKADTDTYGKIEATIQAFLASYREAYRTKDAAALSQALTEDCIRTMQPQTYVKTLQLKHDQISVAEYEAIAGGILPAIEKGQIYLEKRVIDTEKKAASLKVNFHLNMKGGTVDVLEFVFMLELTNACDKIKAVVQFADSAKINDNLAEVKKVTTSE